MAKHCVSMENPNSFVRGHAPLSFAINFAIGISNSIYPMAGGVMGLTPSLCKDLGVSGGVLIEVGVGIDII